MGALVKARLGIFEYPEFAEQVWMPSELISKINYAS